MLWLKHRTIAYRQATKVKQEHEIEERHHPCLQVSSWGRVHLCAIVLTIVRPVELYVERGKSWRLYEGDHSAACHVRTIVLRSKTISPVVELTDSRCDKFGVQSADDGLSSVLPELSRSVGRASRSAAPMQDSP